MNVSRTIFAVFSARTVSMGVQLLGYVFFARRLGPEAIGTFFLFQVSVTILSSIGDLGINDAVTKRLSEGRRQSVVFSTALLLKTLLMVALSVGLLIFSGPLNSYLGASLTLLLILTVAVHQFTMFVMDVLRGQLQVTKTALPLLAHQVTFVALGAYLLTTGAGFRGLIYAYIAGLGVRLVWGVVSARPSIGYPQLPTARSLFDFSKYGFFSSIGRFGFNWADVVIIGYLLTNADVGIYEIPWRVLAIVTLFAGSISTTVFPQLSQWHSQQLQDRIEDLLSEAISAAVLIALPAFFGVLLFSRDILVLVFSEEYAAGWLVFTIIAGERVVHAVDVLLKRTLQAIDRPRFDARTQVVALALNVVLNVVLVLEFGIVGAAVATLAAVSLRTGLHVVYLSRFIEVTVRRDQLAAILGASLFMAVTTYGAGQLVPIATLPALLGIVTFGVVSYGVSILLIPATRSIVTTQLSRVSSQ